MLFDWEDPYTSTAIYATTVAATLFSYWYATRNTKPSILMKT